MKTPILRMERWATIVHDLPTDRHYQVSSWGRIRNQTQKILQGSRIQGYCTLNIRIKKEHRNFYVHKLVAAYFCSQSEADQEFVIHLDYDKHNNRAENLRWVNRTDLTLHNKMNPFILNKHKPLTAKHYKLNASKVLIIKKLIKSGKSRPKMIAKQFGITPTQVSRIKKGENWKHVN